MKRNVTGLLKLDAFIKSADPKDLTPDQSHPERNKGLNDLNPAKRFLYKRYGFVPQAPGSYLAGVNTKGQYVRALAAAEKFSKKDLGLPRRSKGVPLDDKALREHKARIFDILRSAGAFPSPGYVWDRQGPVSERDFIVTMPYPFSEESVSHERGHSKDYRYDYGFDKPVMEQEIAAWNNSGIPEGHPLREAALDTYMAQQEAIDATKYRKLFTGPFTRVKRFTAANKKLNAARQRLLDESAARYAHPDTYIEKYKGDVPILYDYKSIQDAANKGLLDYLIQVR